MKTIEIQLYKFEELSEEAQQNAIEKWRNDTYANGDSLFWFAESCKDYLCDLGFINPDVQYSLSYSQGDGLSFSAEGYTRLKETFLKYLGEHHITIANYLIDNCSLKIKGNTGHYCYAHRSDIDLYLEISGNQETPLIDELIESVQRDITDEYIAACRVLENDGYSQIEYEQSDEYITETLINNEYDFTVEGDMY